ncbi:unnamed protein product [Adineta steineri]|uniref:Fatty acid hydroxylase domain-containing protein n=1 Tax=Adineta steineri TaxID=433720 RepID=A0A818ZNC1_9BILA|nr:unnamed protein product [Adineta steineri]CAF3656103.1 unnamed protein product [Adineta steineri]CAF3770014.1 unnamed protein product [Adineta steineri]
MKSVEEYPPERRTIKAAIEDNIGSCIIAFLSFLSLVSAISWPYIKMNRLFSEHLLDMTSFNDYLVTNVFVFTSYTLQYVLTAGVLEVTNPRGFTSNSLTEEQRQQRRRQIRKELMLTTSAMFGSTTYAVAWMYFIEPYLWTTNYFVTHPYTLTWFISNVIVYGLIFDSWFYWTHRALHESKYLWDHIHTTHHSFKSPSAFCQDAVHPIEGLVQGPMGHYLIALVMPVHPVILALFGLFTSCYAIAAHDGRFGDFNHHYAHHSKGKGRLHNFNYGLYWPLWDLICGTRYRDRPNTNDVNHSLKIKERKEKKFT